MKYRLILPLTILFLFIACTPSSPGGENQEGNTVQNSQELSRGQFYFGTIQFVLMALMVYYFMVLAPERQRLEAQEKFVKGLKKGDDVITSGGIFGKVSSISDEAIVIDCGSNLKLKVLPKNIHQVPKQTVNNQKNATEKNTEKK